MKRLKNQFLVIAAWVNRQGIDPGMNGRLPGYEPAPRTSLRDKVMGLLTRGEHGDTDQ